MAELGLILPRMRRQITSLPHARVHQDVCRGRGAVIAGRDLKIDNITALGELLAVPLILIVGGACLLVMLLGPALRLRP